MNKVSLKGKLLKVKSGTSNKGNFYFFATIEVENGKFPVKIDLKCFESIESITYAKENMEVEIEGNLIRLKGKVRASDGQYLEANLLCVQIKKITLCDTENTDVEVALPESEFDYNDQLF